VTTGAEIESRSQSRRCDHTDSATAIVPTTSEPMIPPRTEITTNPQTEITGLGLNAGEITRAATARNSDVESVSTNDA
jgi:hypothetical protein